MTLKEAIEILEYHRKVVGDVAGSDYANALKLGIEALTRLEELRRHGRMEAIILLPSETEE